MDRPSNNSIHQTVSSTSSSASTAIEAVSSSSSSSGSFCICGRGFLGDMIACENAHCSIEWFHFECVGLTHAVVVRIISYLLQRSCYLFLAIEVFFLKVFLIIIYYYFLIIIIIIIILAIIIMIVLLVQPAGKWFCAACKGGKFMQPISKRVQESPSKSKSKKRKVSNHQSDKVL